MDDKIKLLVSQLGESRINLDVNLREEFDSRPDFSARAFYIATTTRELVRVLDLCRELGIKYLVIGSGGKTIFPKEPFFGLVIKNRSDSIKISAIKGKVSKGGLGVEEVLLEIASGNSFKKVADFSDQQKLTGLEGLKDHSGTFGGTLKVYPGLLPPIEQVTVWESSGEIVNKPLSRIGERDIILTIVLKLKFKRPM